MSDLISRTAAIDTIGEVPDYHDGMVFEALSHAQRDVALLPTVDAVPVVHGRWVKAERRGCVSYSKLYAECDQCHKVVIGGWDYNYCPNCGAKMAERREGDE